ncbi:MAG TPA: hypothetical protein P5280_04745 [Cyclobacteriaceae bacterium]|nr:hypothetical protein [Cyclobacteriaceae bacterium]
MGQNPDAGIYEDADAGQEHLDGMVIGVSGEVCERFSPEAWGLSREIASQVKMVLSGNGCPIIYLAPDILDCGEPIPQILKANSVVKYDGTMFVLDQEGGYDLQEGQMLFESFAEICHEHPSTSVKAIGITLKPQGDEALMQARIEQGDYGELLARVHIWTGDARLVSMDGEDFLNLTAGMQVVVDQHLNIKEAYMMMNGMDDADDVDADAGQAYTAQSEYGGGCNSVPVRPNSVGQYLDTVTPLIIAMVLGRVFRAKVGRSLGLTTFARFFNMLEGKMSPVDSVDQNQANALSQASSKGFRKKPKTPAKKKQKNLRLQNSFKKC